MGRVFRGFGGAIGKKATDYNEVTKSGLFAVNEQMSLQKSLEWNGFPGETNTNPATTGQQLRGYTTTNGDYWIKPSANEPARKVYVNFSNQNNGTDAWALVAKGRNDSDWFSDGAKSDTTMLSTQLTSNTVAHMSSTWVNDLVGYWDNLEMLVNRTLYGDSLKLTGGTSNNTAFQWSKFIVNGGGPQATIRRYSSQWWGGSNTDTETGTAWQDAGANNCNRTFTWHWGSHGSNGQGWSHGNGCTFSGGYVAGGESHMIDRVNVYVRF